MTFSTTGSPGVVDGFLLGDTGEFATACLKDLEGVLAVDHGGVRDSVLDDVLVCVLGGVVAGLLGGDVNSFLSGDDVGFLGDVAGFLDDVLDGVRQDGFLDGVHGGVLDGVHGGVLDSVHDGIVDHASDGVLTLSGFFTGDSLSPPLHP